MLRHESAGFLPPDPRPNGKDRLHRPDPTTTPVPPRDSNSRRMLLWMVLLVPMCMVLSVFASAGSPSPGVSTSEYAVALAAYVLTWMPAVLPLPMLVIASAVCAGVMIKQGLVRRAVVLPPGVAPALGLGVLLSAIHAVWWLAGFVGGLHGTVATVVAWAVVLGPMVLWLSRWRLPGFVGAMTSPPEKPGERENARAGLVVLLAIAAGLGFALVYAVVPPGFLWASEYGGYDALSYHLPLAQEWYTRGWLSPVTHNVYSFLPSYFESAFVHMAAMAGSPQSAPAGSDAPRQVVVGLLAGDGRLVLSAQVLHTLTLGIAAWSVAGLVRVIAERAGLTRDERAWAAVNIACVIAAVLVVTTPWMVVTGTLAYNEAPLVAMLAAAMACALSRQLGPRGRGVLCGVLTGLACCVKPSALVLGAPMVGVAMLVGCWDAVRAAHSPHFARVVTRRLGICVGLCLLAGAITLSPWLIRNQIAAGNPVFPFAAGVLGQGHWSKQQVARYARAHKPDRGVVGALTLLVMPDSRVAADAPAVQRYRGATNPQWMPLMPMGVLGLIALIAIPATRRTGVVLGGGAIVVALAWAAMTHAQSRFLVVLVPIAAGSVGGAAAVVLARVQSRSRIVGGVLLAVVGALTAIVWLTTGPAAQAARQSALATTTYGGPTALTAIPFSEELSKASGDRYKVAELIANATPMEYVALLPDVDLRRVLLVGNATPLYTGPVAYFTTWDTWPLKTADDNNPYDSLLWTRELHEKGYDYAIVDMSEISRLASSGYAPMLPGSVDMWMRDRTRMIRAWNERGVYLVDLRKDVSPRNAR